MHEDCMDVLAHFLWSSAVFFRYKWCWWAGVVGMLPDLLSMGILTIVRAIQFFFEDWAYILGPVPQWLNYLYNFTHSIVIWVLLFWIIWLWVQKPPYIMFAWLLHIVIDIFTHAPGHFPTPILWPFSTWYYAYGVRWVTPLFMVINYSALAVLYGIIALHYRQNRKPHKV